MHYLPVSGLPIIEENEATGEAAELYEESKRVFEVPFVLNIVKAVAIAPNMLAMSLDIFRSFYRHITLPQSLVAQRPGQCFTFPGEGHYPIRLEMCPLAPGVGGRGL